MATNSGDLLGQLLGAALNSGSVRGAGAGDAASGGLPGGLGDILDQVLGGTMGGQQGSPGAGGGLGDILGQVLGGSMGGQGAGNPGAGGALPGGLGDILGQVLGGATGGQPSGQSSGGIPGGLGGLLGGLLGGALAGGAASGGMSGGRTSGGLGDLAQDALGGAAATPAPAPMPQSAPSGAPAGGTEPSGAGDLVKYGGLAVIGMLAFNAFRKWQSQSASGSSRFVEEAAPGFSPAQAPGGPEAFSQVLVKAMAAAAQADGKLDQDEVNRISGGVSRMGAAAPSQVELVTALSTPVDPQELINAATSPEAALQIYAASVMAIRPDSAVEQRYLANLAESLAIDPALKAQIDRDLAA